MKRLVAPILCGLVFIVLLSCSTSSPSAALIIGTWQSSSDGDVETQEFNPDGSVSDSSNTFATQIGTWSVSGSALTITYPETSALNYSVSFPDENTMIESPAGAGPSLTFMRLAHL